MSCKSVQKKSLSTTHYARQRTLVWWDWANGWHFVSAVDVADEGTDFADDSLPGQTDHQRGAVIALEWRAERPHQELVGLQHVLLLLLADSCCCHGSCRNS